MRPVLNIILCLVSIMVVCSCKEVYDPDEIISNEKIPVVLGNINAGDPPEVILSWAIGFDNNKTSYIHDAQVWITDDAGNYENMEETMLGKYIPVNENFTGVMGRTYTLHVETAEGDLYESTPERIYSGAQLDSLFAVAVDRTRYIRTATGDLFPRPEEGLDIKLSLSKETDSTYYFRFKTDVLKEILYIVTVDDPLVDDTTTYLYEWQSSTRGDFYDVRYTYPGVLKQVVPEQYLGYLDFIYSPWLATEERSAPLTYAWIISAHVYSISENVYRYYHSVEKQLDGKERIFAPVPAQIETNLLCVNDYGKKIMGVFEATSENVFYKAFHWIESGKFKSKALDSFPEDLGNGQILGDPPDFWISFPEDQ